MRKVLLCFLIITFAWIGFQAPSFAAKKIKKAVRIVEIQTQDDVILSGKLTIPDNANVKNKVPVVILLHSLGGNYTVYDKLSEKLKNNGIASFSVDLRGHAKSVTKLNGKKTYWQNYSNKIFLKYPNDINDIINFLKENYISLDANSIAIVGADISANAATISASKNPEQIKTIILMSPSLSFKGLDISATMMRYPNPVLIFVSINDISHAHDARILSKYPIGKTKLITTQKGGTGDNLLKTNPQVYDEIIMWLKENL